MNIDASKIDYDGLNNYLKSVDSKELVVENVIGQRYIGSGIINRKIIVKGTPGNALGAYLDNSEIVVYGNGQDATGDTMNSGEIIIHGSVGDATGYAMRGGAIYVEKNAGYRVGIHMKEYKEQKPVIVVGEYVGQFLGEYQAGGTIVVLGIGCNGQWPVGEFCATGIHGGSIYVRADEASTNLPKNILCEEVENLDEIKEYIKKYDEYFNKEVYNILINSKFFKLSPNRENPYKQLYVGN